MRAMVMHGYGGPSALVIGDMPRPSPGPGYVLIHVLASSVNPVDWKQGSGRIRFFLPASFPHVPGYDVAGVVTQLGAGVADFKIGDRVHGRIPGRSGGACAEVVLASADVLSRIPEGMEIGEAAGLPLAGLTALQGLRDVGGMALSGYSGRVLVVGASGGVGHLAVQIAHAAGAQVTGVCSAKNAHLVRGLGADVVIDYTKVGCWGDVEPWDLILDCVGSSPAEFLPRLRPTGVFASCMPRPAVFAHTLLNSIRGRKVRAAMLRTHGPDLALLDTMVAAGRLRVVIDSRYPLERLAEAWTRSRTGRAVGKIVVDVASR